MNVLVVFSATVTVPADAGRGIVDRREVERDGVRRLVEVLAAIGRAAVVLHLEREAAVRRAAGVGRAGEQQFAERDVADQHELTGRDGQTIQGQRAVRRQGRNPDRQEGVRRGVLRIGEAEVGHRKRVGLVLVDVADRLVRAGRGMMLDRNVDRNRIRRRVEVGVGRRSCCRCRAPGTRSWCQLGRSAGVKTSRLASRSATRIESPAFTGLPLSVRLPASGSVLSTTEARLLAGVSLASVKPKSA